MESEDVVETPQGEPDAITENYKNEDQNKEKLASLDDKAETPKVPSIPVDNRKSFFVYDQYNEIHFQQILKVLSTQSIVGIATLFNERSIKAGLRNLSWFIVSATSPEITYIFNCYSIDCVEIFLALRRILKNPDVLKVVHGVRQTIGYLYQCQKIEVQNVMDIEICDRVLRKLDETSSTSLEELIKLYVKPDFIDPSPIKKDATSEDQQKIHPDRVAEQAAMQGAFLVDIFRSQQQLCIASAVQHLGPKIRCNIEARIPRYVIQSFKLPLFMSAF